MKYPLNFLGGFLLFALSFSTLSAQEPALPPVPLEFLKGIEVQSQGPVHEAFVQPTDVPPQPSEIIPKAPPPMVPEKVPVPSSAPRVNVTLFPRVTEPVPVRVPMVGGAASVLRLRCPSTRTGLPLGRAAAFRISTGLALIVVPPW